MARMTIMEAAEHFGISKEAIHNRVRRGSLIVNIVDGVKYVDVDALAPKSTTTTKASTRRSTKSNDDRYYKLLEEQNVQLQTKVEKLEGETRSLRDQKEEMLIQEREKIEQIYKDKDEQLKNLLNTIASQFMLNAPSVQPVQEEHLEAEIENLELDVKESIEEVTEESNEESSDKGELISLKKYLKKHHFSEKKKEKIIKRFTKKAKKDERIIVLSGKFYIDSVKYDYSDLLQ